MTNDATIVSQVGPVRRRVWPIHHDPHRNSRQMGPKTGCERLARDRIRSQADDNNYAVAFLVLVDRLGLTDRCPSKTDGATQWLRSLATSLSFVRPE
jgi:hypothetical protein